MTVESHSQISLCGNDSSHVFRCFLLQSVFSVKSKFRQKGKYSIQSNFSKCSTAEAYMTKNNQGQWCETGKTFTKIGETFKSKKQNLVNSQSQSLK